jgi:hypothetical protein
VGIAHLASDADKESLLKKIYDSPEFHHNQVAPGDGVPKGFSPYETI